MVRRVGQHPSLSGGSPVGEGWRDGTAFLRLLHSYRPDLVDLATLRPGDALHNCSAAFAAAESLGVAALLDPADMRQLDRRSLLTYLAALHRALEPTATNATNTTSSPASSSRKESVDSGVASDSSGQTSPVGKVVRRRGGQGARRGVRSLHEVEVRARWEGEERARSISEGEERGRRMEEKTDDSEVGESTFASAFRKFSSLTLSQDLDCGGIGEERGREEQVVRAREEKLVSERKVVERRGRSVAEKREMMERELISRGCQTEESFIRSCFLWGATPPPSCQPTSPSTLKQATPSSHQHTAPLLPPFSHVATSPHPPLAPLHPPSSYMSTSPHHPPAPPAKQRLALRLKRIQEVRRRQRGASLPFTSLPSTTYGIPCSPHSLPHGLQVLPHTQFSTLV